MFDIVIDQLLSVVRRINAYICRLVVVLVLTEVLDVSDATVVCSGRQRVGAVQSEVVVGVARAGAARVDVRRTVRALDEVAPRVDVRK